MPVKKTGLRPNLPLVVGGCSNPDCLGLGEAGVAEGVLVGEVERVRVERLLDSSQLEEVAAVVTDHRPGQLARHHLVADTLKHQPNYR